MRSYFHAVSLLLSLILAFIIVQSPYLANYSLQAIAITTFIFFGSKIWRRKKIYHLLPESNSFDMVLITFALMIIVGSTGNLDSPLSFLVYIHLFVLVMTTNYITAILTGAGALLFHYSLITQFEIHQLSQLITIPIVLIFFLFAKEQKEETHIVQKKHLFQHEELLSKQFSLEYRDITIDRLASTNRNYREKIESLNVMLAKLKIDLLTMRRQYFDCEPDAKFKVDQLCSSINEVLDNDEST